MTFSWKDIIIWIPVFVILVEVLDFFFLGYLSYARGGILLILIPIYFLTHTRVKTDSIGWSIFLFLLYIFPLIFFSNDVSASFLSYLSIFTSLIFYNISYHEFDEKFKLKKLNILITIIPLLFIVNFLIYSGLGIGPQVYGGILRFGNLHHNVIYVGALVFGVFLFIYNTQKKNFPHLLLIGVLLIVLFLSLRRTLILLIIVSILIYLVLTDKKKALKIVTFVALFLTVTYPLYSNYLIAGIEARGYRATVEANTNIDKESRIVEMEVVNDMIFEFDDIKYSLIGKEFLNSEGTYHAPGFVIAADRPLHTDYAVILHGSGLIGLFLYFLILLSIAKKVIRHIKIYGPKNSISIILSILTAILFLVTFSGSLLSIGFRITLFILLGLFMRISHEMINSKYHQY